MISKKTFICTLSALTIVGAFGVAYAAFTPGSWNYYRNISTPSAAYSQGFTKIILPEDIARGAKDFSDVRIIADNTTEVPYFLTRNAVVRGGETPGRILDKTVINGSEQFIVDTGQENLVYTGVSLSSYVNNFRRQVKIYTSSSLLSLSDAGWNVVTEGGYVFKFEDPTSSYSSGKDFVDFSAHTSRYMKVVIAAGEEGPVDVSSVNIYSERRIDVPSYSKNVSFSLFNNSKNKSSEMIIDLGESGHLTNAVTLYPTDKNYMRRVLIEASDDISATSSWQFVGQGSISGIATSLFNGYSNRVTYLEQKTRYIRVSVINDDNRPLTLNSSVLVEGPIVSLIFETRAGENYSLYYGNPVAVAPTYDISSISSYIEENSLPQSTVGVESINPLYVAPAPKVVPFSEAYPWLLNTVLVFVVVLIAVGIVWYIYLYVKKNK